MGMGIALLMIALLLFKKQRKGGELYLVAWIGASFCQMLFYEFNLYQDSLSGIPAILGFSLVLLNMPLLHGYIRYMMAIPLKLMGLILHLSPYILYVMFFIGIVSLWEVGVTAQRGFLIFDKNAPPWVYYYAIPSAILSTVYCIWNLVLLQKHRERLPQIFSYQEKISLAWIQYLIYGYLLFTILGMILVFGATTFGWFSIDSIFGVVGGVLGLLITFTGFWGLRQTAIFSDLPISEDKKGKVQAASYQKSGLSEERAKGLAHKLLEHMEKEQVFLEEDLTLPALAQKLGISASHLSQVINQQFGQNFFDFVNSYRIKEAQKRLRDPQYGHYSVLGIALDCGFSSKSSFNRSFKKIVGMTPTQYRKNSSPQ